MFKIIFHQLWNQRRMNGWIFAELLVVTFFLWITVDPICVLTGTRNIAPGYESKGRYVVRLGTYQSSHGNYKEESQNDSLRVSYYYHVARLLRDLPEVESYTVPVQLCFPNSMNWSGGQLFRDTAAISEDKFVHHQFYSFVTIEGSNPFSTYGLKDVRTGEDLQMPEDCTNRVFVSENLARELFGGIDVIGKKVYYSYKGASEIAGVFADYKHFDYGQPYALMISFEKEIVANRWMHWRYPFVLKLKKGVDEKAFEARFREEIVPQLSIGNLYFSSLKKFSEISNEYSEMTGTNNKYRLQYALVAFVILCIFLGMLGSFWIRCNARRQEIGVMRSMGASQQRIMIQFLVEAVMLVTVAFLCMLPVLFNYVYINGMATSLPGGTMPVLNSAYWMNNFGEHFGVVSLVTYLILLVISLMGIIIPVTRASRVLPAEALRDE